MPEIYLHYLWFTKQIGLLDCRLTSGKLFEIIDFGKYNATSSGPDFSDVLLKIDGLIWSGSVEMHINSSDWYNHKHHLDKTYDKVILHVVYNYNQQVLLPHGELITFELKHQINHAHLIWFNNYYIQPNHLPCQRMTSGLSQNGLYMEWLTSAKNRLDKKVRRYLQKNMSSDELLYRLLARTFGGITNQLPFDELTARLPLTTILSVKPSGRIKLILKMSGLDELVNQNFAQFSDQIDSFTSIQNSSWKRKGQRYYSHPVIRVQQFAFFISNWEQFIEKVNLDLSNFFSNWKVIIAALNSMLKTAEIAQISKSFQQQILINCIAPFFYFKNEFNTQIPFILLEHLPPESNSITKKWKQVNQFSKNALHSQGSLEYFQDFCLNFKCLQCKLGKQVINGNYSENNLFL